MSCLASFLAGTSSAEEVASALSAALAALEAPLSAVSIVGTTPVMRAGNDE